jgi:hypothetical protein
MMNGGRTRIDEKTHERELEMHRREITLERHVNHLEQSLKIAEWLLGIRFSCLKKKSCHLFRLMGAGVWKSFLHRPGLWAPAVSGDQPKKNATLNPGLRIGGHRGLETDQTFLE